MWQAKTLLLATVALLAIRYLTVNVVEGCKKFWDPTRPGLRKPNCTAEYPYLPILNGAYCYNNGSGICKAFAGQFEFYFNTMKDEYLFHAPASDYVDSYGYHKRIPVSYNINGSINYVDRSINWAKTFKESQKGRSISLLSTRDFNWCGYTERDWWPYKSSIIDHKSGGRFHIYFYNRQSCIYDSQSGSPPKPPQHFNTRFLHKSDLRIDLDYNPTIFAMEDELAGEVRLVKHKRQHWYEVEYKVIENPTPDILYFVDMASTQREPCKIDGQRQSCMLTAKAFDSFSDLCLSQSYHNRSSTSPKNNVLFQPWCGLDEVEISDWPMPVYSRKARNFLEADLHNLPRDPKSSESFFGIKIANEAEWEIFAKDGFVFSAMTTIPVASETNNQTVDPDRVRVIMLYSNYNADAQSKYDEYYPLPYLADYIATCEDCGSDQAKWSYDRKKNEKQLTNLNYVDDIAYLHKCQTVLIIFGPLYSELPADQFDIDSKAPVDSIYELGIWEIANAFFAQPDSDLLWVYHRTNWISSYKYTCASASGKPLVTAVRSSQYLPRHGNTQPEIFFGPTTEKRDTQFDTSEETLFAAIGVFRGTRSPEAPNPTQYPLGSDNPAQPEEERSSTLVYAVMGIGILLIIAMLIACMVTLRRRHKHRRLHDMLTTRSSGGVSEINLQPSKRSTMTSIAPASHHASGSGMTRATSRSAMRSGSGSSYGTPSARSMLRSKASHSSRSKGSNTGTIRSKHTSKSKIHPGPSTRSDLTSIAHHPSASKRSSTYGSEHGSSHGAGKHASHGKQ